MAAPDDVVVLQLLQEGDLPDGCAGDALLLLLQSDLLQRDSLPAHPIPRLVHHCGSRKQVSSLTGTPSEPSSCGMVPEHWVAMGPGMHRNLNVCIST